MSSTGVFGDKGFTGTDYITTPVRKPEDRELYMRLHKPHTAPHMLGRVVATTTLIKYNTIPAPLFSVAFGHVAGLRTTMWIIISALVCFTAVAIQPE